MVIYQATDLMFALVCQALPQTFDSHRFIEVVKAMFPQEYQTDLAMRRALDPERSLHSLYAKRLRRMARLTPTRRVRSTNVRGGNTLNQEWRQ